MDTHTHTHTYTFIKQELTCKKAVLHSLYRLIRQRKEKWLAHDYSTVCVCVLHGGETGREMKSKVSGHLRIFLSTYFLENTYIYGSQLCNWKKQPFFVCVCPLWACFCVHTHISMVVEGVGVKKEKRRHPESTDLGARRDKGGICPCSGSRKWPLNRRLELEEQEVFILLEESFKVQEFLFHKAFVNIWLPWCLRW